MVNRVLELEVNNSICVKEEVCTDKMESKNNEDILPGYKSFEEFREASFKAVVEATRSSNSLPTGKNWDYYTTFPSFKKVMDTEGARVLKLISLVLHHQGLRGNILRRDFEEKFDLIVDANDSILERVACNLDEVSGIRRNPEPVLVEAVGSCTRPVNGSWNLVQSQNLSQTSGSAPQPVRLLTAKNIQRPQIEFKDKIDNSSSPFEPRIKEKPNSLKPLAITLQLTEDGEESFSHPYEFELERFTPSAKQLERVKPRMYKQLEETPLVMVEHADQLPGLLQDLSSYSEISVDLEHHSYRSFQGFTCLMQISTRDTDYIIDTLLLRDKLCCLNEIFTKPSIIKVFHGAMHDIEWLQRDLSVYMVNMFDTHEAAKLLSFGQLSLAFLMKHYCNVVADKHYQLADWRIRPLPDELVMYARKDTHYLLYIYDMMQNALLDAANGQKNLLRSVFQQSTEICKTRYEKPVLREDSHMLLYRRNKRLFDNRQLYALRELYRWRDRISREDDESTGYVLPNHMMLQIAESLPREMQGILACCNPIPPIVRQNLHKLHAIVLEARDQPLVKPLLEEELWTRVSTQNWSKVNLDGALHCPHDLTHIQDFRNDLPTLLGNTDNINETEVGAKKIQMNKPMISVFEAEAEIDTPNHVTFVCPYERYKKMKPFIQSQETTLTSTKNTETVPGTEDDNAEQIQRIKDHFVEVSSKMVKEEAEEEAEKTNSAITTHSLPPLPPSPEPERSEEMETLRSKVCRKRKNRKKDSSAQPSKRLKLDESVEVNSPSTSVPRTGSKKMKEEGFQPFDYSKVNFSRFQGGSSTSAQIKNEGKPKGKKRKRRHGKNKSMTFERNQW